MVLSNNCWNKLLSFPGEVEMIYKQNYHLTILLITTILLLLSTNTYAKTINLTASLDAAQETAALNPATPATATGNAAINFDTISKQLTWNINFSGLSAAAVAAHFHGPAGVGQAAGVQVNIGTISGLSSPMAGSTVLTTAQENELLSGLWYINIHTALNPPGEIRGQTVAQTSSVSAIPTLAQWSMIGLMSALLMLSMFQLKRFS